MVDAVIQFLRHMAETTPLTVFVTVGGFIEEIIAPIPSPLVATLAGSIAETQQMGITGLLWICVIGTAAKTAGAFIFYWLGDKFEDVLIPRFGKYIGVRHEDVERLGKRFTGKLRQDFLLFFLRSIPVMPSTPLSVVCGVVKVRPISFIIATYAGFYIRNFFFLYLGYTGLAAAGSLMEGIDTAETVFKVVIVLGIAAVLGWLYWRRSKGKPVDFLGK